MTVVERIGAAADVLRASTAVTIFTHRDPDADTLASALALARTLKSKAIAAEVVSVSGWPRTMAFLPGVSEIRPRPRLQPDAVVTVDCATPQRIGAELLAWVEGTDATLINVDHHVTNRGFGDIACVDVAAPATARIVAQLLEALGGSLDPETATLLMAGVVHDTDGLRSPDTTAETLRFVADLRDAGGSYALVVEELLRRPPNVLRLWGRALARMELLEGGRLVLSAIEKSDFDDTATLVADVDDLPEMLLAQGTSIAVLLRRLADEPEGIRVSIRTADGFDAANIASALGGGGHRRAAGCVLQMDMERARQHVLEVASLALASPRPS